MQGVGKLLEIVAGAAFHVFAHHLHALARGGGDRLAGQLLAQHQAQRGVQGHFVGALRAGDGIARQPPLVHGFHVGAHARIFAFANGFVAHAFDGIVAGARIGVLGPHAGMQRAVVMAQPQCEAIGKTPRLARFGGGDVAPGHRHAGRLAGLRGLVRGPADLRLAIMRNGACRTGKGGLEAVEGGFFGHIARPRLETVRPGAQGAKGHPARRTR